MDFFRGITIPNCEVVATLEHMVTQQGAIRLSGTLVPFGVMVDLHYYDGRLVGCRPAGNEFDCYMDRIQDIDTIVKKLPVTRAHLRGIITVRRNLAAAKPEVYGTEYWNLGNSIHRLLNATSDDNRGDLEFVLDQISIPEKDNIDMGSGIVPEIRTYFTSLASVQFPITDNHDKEIDLLIRKAFNVTVSNLYPTDYIRFSRRGNLSDPNGFFITSVNEEINTYIIQSVNIIMGKGGRIVLRVYSSDNGAMETNYISNPEITHLQAMGVNRVGATIKATCAFGIMNMISLVDNGTEGKYFNTNFSHCPKCGRETISIQGHPTCTNVRCRGRLFSTVRFVISSHMLNYNMTSKRIAAICTYLMHSKDLPAVALFDERIRTIDEDFYNLMQRNRNIPLSKALALLEIRAIDGGTARRMCLGANSIAEALARGITECSPRTKRSIDVFLSTPGILETVRKLDQILGNNHGSN